jgi:hypothetical protein
VELIRDPTSNRGVCFVTAGKDGKLCWWDFKTIDEAEIDLDRTTDFEVCVCDEKEEGRRRRQLRPEQNTNYATQSNQSKSINQVLASNQKSNQAHTKTKPNPTNQLIKPNQSNQTNQIKTKPI